MAKDTRIDDYIAKAQDFAKPILTRLREIVHATLPEADETIKWGMPHFTVQGKNLAGMAAFKAHCSFMIHGDGRQGDAMGQFGKLSTLSDIPAEAELAAKLIEANERIAQFGSAEKSSKAPRKAKPELPVPDDLAAALKKDASAGKVFADFPPGARRDYIEWITSAKREETREKRLAQAVEWIAEGKKRNWKYEKC
ncbi:MAG: YdeI/OmpD-associated family protein [Sphingomonadaceae bacterium]